MVLVKLLFSLSTLLCFISIVNAESLCPGLCTPTPTPRPSLICNETFSLCLCKLNRNKSLLDCRYDASKGFEGQIIGFSEFKTPKIKFNLLKVDLSENAINFEPQVFLESKKRRLIQYLDLSHNLLDINSSTIFDSFDNLKFLNLSGNRINQDNRYTGLPYEYQKKLENGSYEWLSSKLAKTLEVLDLSHNYLNRIPVHILTRFVNLKHLILDKSMIGHFELKGLHMPNLEELSLQGCNIREIHGELSDAFPNLKRLSLRNNQIIKLPRLTHMPKLIYLDLTNNKILYLDSKNNENTSIETLLLGENIIKHIKNGALRGFPNLTKLDLHKNHLLNSIDKNAFQTSNDQPIELQELDLSDCAFQTLNPTFLPWNQFKIIRVKGNPFYCDIQLRWFITNCVILTKDEKDQLRCASPKSLENRKFTDVTHDMLLKLEKEKNVELIVEVPPFEEKEIDIRIKSHYNSSIGVKTICFILLVVMPMFLCCCAKYFRHFSLKKPIVILKNQNDHRRLSDHQSLEPDFKFLEKDIIRG